MMTEATVANFVVDDDESLVVETRLNYERMLVTANVRPSASGDVTLSLMDSLAFKVNGTRVLLAGDAGRPCEWSPNWQLTVMRSAVCGHAAQSSCNLEASAWPALEIIGAKKDIFSLRGFMSKFAKLCKKISLRYLHIWHKGIYSSYIYACITLLCFRNVAHGEESPTKTWRRSRARRRQQLASRRRRRLRQPQKRMNPTGPRQTIGDVGVPRAAEAKAPAKAGRVTAGHSSQRVRKRRRALNQGTAAAATTKLPWWRPKPNQRARGGGGILRHRR
jgi:hypothetical protein